MSTTPSLPGATAAGAATLLDHSEDYRAAKTWAGTPLESGDVTALTDRALALVRARGLILPDADVLVERAVVALLGGHVILTGPPGTGKTTLAEILAAAFGCSSQIETATADWSSYDVVGGLQPQAAGSADYAIEVLRPWLGHVSRAAVTCADTIARRDHDQAGNPEQAHWLILDEFNRADIDKAIGPLYTALARAGEGVAVPLWFGDAPERSEVWLPARFRLIGTMNTVDTSYVFSLSQGLTRRFGFLHVGVPTQEQLEDEVRSAAEQAAAWHERSYGGSASDALADERLPAACKLLQDFVSLVRYSTDSQPGWPLGTAPLVDVMRQVMLRRDAARTEVDGLIPAVDLAIADRIVPQMTALSRDQLGTYRAALTSPPLDALQRTDRAITQVVDAHTTTFA